MVDVPEPPAAAEGLDAAAAVAAAAGAAAAAAAAAEASSVIERKSMSVVRPRSGAGRAATARRRRPGTALPSRATWRSRRRRSSAARGRSEGDLRGVQRCWAPSIWPVRVGRLGAPRLIARNQAAPAMASEADDDEDGAVPAVTRAASRGGGGRGRGRSAGRGGAAEASRRRRSRGVRGGARPSRRRAAAGCLKKTTTSNCGNSSSRRGSRRRAAELPTRRSPLGRLGGVLGLTLLDAVDEAQARDRRRATESWLVVQPSELDRRHGQRAAQAAGRRRRPRRSRSWCRSSSVSQTEAGMTRATSCRACAQSKRLRPGA